MTLQFLQAGVAFLVVISIVGCSRQEAPTALTPPTNTLTPMSMPNGARHLAPALSTSATGEVSTSTPQPVIKQRSKKKSALIVGGSAAAGAAIGALAGGGKGAGIGAIAGGISGLVYDRTTAKKSEPVR